MPDRAMRRLAGRRSPAFPLGHRFVTESRKFSPAVAVPPRASLCNPHRKRRMRIGLLCCLLLFSTTALAQNTPPPLTEETEPRRVGTRGSTTIGFAGFLDRTYSSEELPPLFVTAQLDIARFVTDRVAVRAGVVGQGRFGGETELETTGADASALHAAIGAQFYFTPASLLSLYSGVDYRYQLTTPRQGDAGFVIPKVGLEGTVSSRASFFAEGGFGIAVRRGSEGELNTRVNGQLGLRIRF